MSFGAGDAPFLSREVIAGSIEANISDMLDEFPIYNLFCSTSSGRPRMLAGEHAVFDVDYQEKRKADIHAQPGLADRFRHTRYGQISVTMLYEQVKDCLRPNELAQLRMVGLSGQETPTSKDAADKLAKIVTRGTRTILRSREQDCSSMLSSASYTRTVDGVANTITTGQTLLGSGWVSANWATASTDIIGDIGKMLETHIDKAGEDPTDCAISFLTASQIAKNDKVRALLNGAGQLPANSLGYGGVISGVFAALGVPGVNVVVHKSHYKNASGTKTYYWSISRMSLLSLQMGADVLGYLSCPVIQVDGSLTTESIDSHSWWSPETEEHSVKIKGRGAPYLGDLDKMTLFDLTGA